MSRQVERKNRLKRADKWRQKIVLKEQITVERKSF